MTPAGLGQEWIVKMAHLINHDEQRGSTINYRHHLGVPLGASPEQGMFKVYTAEHTDAIIAAKVTALKNELIDSHHNHLLQYAQQRLGEAIAASDTRIDKKITASDARTDKEVERLDGRITALKNELIDIHHNHLLQLAQRRLGKAIAASDTRIDEKIAASDARTDKEVERLDGRITELEKRHNEDLLPKRLCQRLFPCILGKVIKSEELKDKIIEVTKRLFQPRIKEIHEEMERMQQDIERLKKENDELRKRMNTYHPRTS